MTTYRKPDTACEQVALSIAQRAHEGQVDKAGRPYIEHPQRVASQLGSAHARAAALLHDVLEDTPVTADDLLAAGIPEPVVAAVVALTKRTGESYEAYLGRVKANPLARSVKLADIADNLNLARLPHITPKDRERAAKYERARAFLLSAD